jgi:hypothetical protein
VQEEAEEGAEACLEVQEGAGMMRLPTPVTAEELSAQLATISSEIDGYISLPSEAKLPAPLLAAAFQEYEAYAGRPPADEHEACHVQVHMCMCMHMCMHMCMCMCMCMHVHVHVHVCVM